MLRELHATCVTDNLTTLTVAGCMGTSSEIRSFTRDHAAKEGNPKPAFRHAIKNNQEQTDDAEMTIGEHVDHVAICAHDLPKVARRVDIFSCNCTHGYIQRSSCPCRGCQFEKHAHSASRAFEKNHADVLISFPPRMEQALSDHFADTREIQEPK